MTHVHKKSESPEIFLKPVERHPAAQVGDGLASAIKFIARLQGRHIDRLRLHQAISMHCDSLQSLSDSQIALRWREVVREILMEAGVDAIELQAQPDQARLPVLGWVPGMGWVVVRNLNSKGQWLIDHQGAVIALTADVELPCIRIKFAEGGLADVPAARQMIKREFLKQKPTLIEAGIAGVLINVIALVVSFYSMQVYDRVIPSQGYSTLIVLTIGVGIALFFDLAIKFARSYLIEHAVSEMDYSLSRQIFLRFLGVRLDQLPTTVGSLSAQLRGYETIRSFLSASTFYLLVDVPFGLFFVIMIAIIASPIVALVPLFFLLLALALGFAMRGMIDAHAEKSTNATNMKTGILVEAIEGAETIKSGGGAWNILSKWLDANSEALTHDMAMKRVSEKSSYLSSMMQQLSYTGLIATGAYFAAEGHMTMGSLIACSILSGRAIGPITQIPALMVQAGHARSALKNLERVFVLESDNHGVERPLLPDSIKGHYQFERVRFAYQNSPKALVVQDLEIEPGEKVGVIGAVGSGKSTLLRLLTGMYQAVEGRVLLDGLDIDQIDRSFLNERICYLQQEHRLFSGTLRENLLIGMPDPGDARVRDAAEMTGLLSIISNHPKGLDLMISEGGKGLSGGQKQLVAFTRLVLGAANVWLLDEPTASMDGATELGCVNVLKQKISSDDTLVLVTHKPSLLSLVHRIIVVSNHEIVIDGPRDDVLGRLAELNNFKTPRGGIN